MALVLTVAIAATVPAGRSRTLGLGSVFLECIKMNETEYCRDLCSSKEGTMQMGRGFTRYRSNDSGPDVVIVSDPELKQKLLDFVDSQFPSSERRPRPHYTELEAEAVQLITNDLAVLIEAGKVSEPERARLHDLTRKVRMTDDDCADVVMQWAEQRRVEPAGGSIIDLVLDLRDRYEEIGKYAPEVKP